MTWFYILSPSCGHSGSLMCECWITVDHSWSQSSAVVKISAVIRSVCEGVSVQSFLCRLLFERSLRAHGAPHGSLHQPGDQVDADERPAGRPQPVPPEPALRLHPASSAGGRRHKNVTALRDGHLKDIKIQNNMFNRRQIHADITVINCLSFPLSFEA